MGRTPAATQITVPTRACAKESMRRSNRVQHGESMPQERVLGWRPLYWARMRAFGRVEGAISSRVESRQFRRAA